MIVKIFNDYIILKMVEFVLYYRYPHEAPRVSFITESFLRPKTNNIVLEDKMQSIHHGGFNWKF